MKSFPSSAIHILASRCTATSSRNRRKAYPRRVGGGGGGGGGVKVTDKK